MIELIIVVVIIGIIASFALPAFRVTKENALDREAIANLRLIQAAQKIYGMEGGLLYNTSWGGGATSNEGINNILRLSVPIGAERNWNYVTYADNTTRWFCAQATSVRGSARIWYLPSTSEDPTRENASQCNP